MALYALHEGGGVAVDHPVYRRGVDFLLRTQLADGSWFVASRSFPIVEYFEERLPAWQIAIHLGRRHLLGDNGTNADHAMSQQSLENWLVT